MHPSRVPDRRRSRNVALSAVAIAVTISFGATVVLAGPAEDCAKGGEAGIAACTALIDQTPEDGGAYVSRGKAYLDKAEYDKAVADFTEAIAIDPTDAKAYFHRGNAYLKLGKGPDAKADFQQALTLDPDYADAKAALESALAEPKNAGPQETASPTPEQAPQADVEDKDSALSALNSAPRQETSPLSGSADGRSSNSSNMAIFVPDLPDESAPPSAAPSWPTTQVAAKNYADETTDWGVQQQTVLKKDVGKKTPISLPGARRITTQELLQIGPQSLLIDVLDDTDHHITLPGAVHMPGAGNYGGGRFNDKLQKKFAKVLAKVTNDNLDRQLVFFCYGAECWESYNAALRAINMGFHNVLWYRGGLESWKDAELPLAPPASIFEVR